MNTSLYLSQSYQDAWEDYQRSLNNTSFPVWNYIILTASNEHQAEGFRAQIESRKGCLPDRTTFAVVSDEGGERIGSGGATLAALRYIREREDHFDGLRILVIHSGGDSKRVPQYSALGKLFSPVPHEFPDGRGSSLFDEFMITMSAVPGRLREGMLLLSGDVLLLFNPLLIDYPGHGAAVISFKEDVHVGKNHGVFLRGEQGFVQAFLHKQSVETLQSIGAVNDAGAVDIDTGALIFGVDILEALWSLISSEGKTDPDKYKMMVNSRTRLSLYGDFQYPLAESSSLEAFYREKPEGEFCPELEQARTAVWKVLRPFRMKLLRMAPAKFIHFGTTGEILDLMGEEIESYRDLGWNRCVNCSLEGAAGYSTVMSPEAQAGENCYLETAYIHGGVHIGSHCILSYIDIHEGVEIPDHTVLHGLKQMDGSFVCRIYGVEDNPKEDRLFGKKLTGNLWKEGEEKNLWNARLYPACRTVREAVDYALSLYYLMQEGRIEEIENWKNRKSLCSGFNDADPAAILTWSKRMRELTQMDRLASRIENGEKAETGILKGPLTAVQKQWLKSHGEKADWNQEMRLRYYVGRALEKSMGEQEINKAFAVLSQGILQEVLSGLRERTAVRIRKEEHSVSLPLRVNWGGGWSDTPPYCNEKGGTVLNAAILLNGDRPVKVKLQKLSEKKVIFESRDMDVRGEFSDIEELQAVGDPFDAFVLQKAALLACGIIPAVGGDLQEILERLGGGIAMDTEVAGVPKGSGLGTSSILAAACVKGLFEFLGVEYAEEDLYSHVLCMEQIMSTGGGWQDQVGGVTDGIKYITSGPGLRQELRVEHIRLAEETKKELNERFVLIYTGQRRLARNLLRDVVGRYIGNEPETVQALNEIQRLAALMRFELERGHVDDFAELLSAHWEWSKRIDSGSSNTLIDQIFDATEDLAEGKMVCGAGGGGFLQVVLKKNVMREQLQNRLRSVFQDTEIGVWNCELV